MCGWEVLFPFTYDDKIFVLETVKKAIQGTHQFGEIPSKFLQSRCGVFVTIGYNKEKVLGCSGTVEPVCENLFREIINSAILCFRSRGGFSPERLKGARIVVNIIGPLQRADINELFPERFGLLLIDGPKRGVVLPGEAKTPRWQLYMAKRAAGVLGNDFELYIFPTIKIDSKEVYK